MTAKRVSLKDRNRAAIANQEPAAAEQETPREPAPQTVVPVSEGDGGGEQRVNEVPQAKAAPRATKSTPRKAAAHQGSVETARLGIYLTPDGFDDARASYLADWMNGGDADTFARWIAGAMDRHAARTPQQRAARDRLRGRSETRTGSTRSFSIPVSTMQRMRAAISADQQAGRWPSDSAWCAEAIALAIEDARAANGGVLPTPPARLPNRLLRDTQDHENRSER